MPVTCPLGSSHKPLSPAPWLRYNACDVEASASDPPGFPRGPRPGLQPWTAGGPTDNVVFVLTDPFCERALRLKVRALIALLEDDGWY